MLNAQTYKNWQVILIDDNTNDGTREKVDEFLTKHQINHILIRNKSRKNILFDSSRNI
jgi:glycosyltransferase involved in cell wall biosynthesis